MKYYDLVFEVGIGKQYFSWVLQTVGPFRVFMSAPFAVLVTAGYTFSSILPTVFLSFNSDD